MTTTDTANHWYLIVNPSAGGGSGARRATDVLAQLRRAGVDADVAYTKAPMHGAELAARALERGWRRIAAVGGDGTAHEVVNGVASQSAVPAADVVVAPVPVGTGNDWAHSLGLPRRALDVAALLVHGDPVACDLGRIEYSTPGGRASRYFVNVAGAGFDAFVLARLAPGKSGRLAYLREVLRGARHFPLTTLSLRGGGVAANSRALVAFASLGRYCGGGMDIATAARLDDGLADVTLVSAMSGWQVLVEARRLFDGTLPRSRFARCWSAESLEIDADVPTGVEADGEILGGLPARIDVIPRALRVIAPPSQPRLRTV